MKGLFALLATPAVVAAVFFGAGAARGSTPPPLRHATRTLGVTKDSPRPLVCTQAVEALRALAGAPGRDSARVRLAVRTLAVRACWK